MSREGCTSQELLDKWWNQPIKVVNHLQPWTCNLRQEVKLAEQLLVEISLDKLEKDQLEIMVLVQPVTVSTISLEITATSQQSMTPRVSIVIRLRAESYTQEEYKKRRLQNLKLEMEALVHTPVRVIKWVHLANKTWQGSMKIIKRQKKQQRKARSNQSFHKDLVPNKDQSPKFLMQLEAFGQRLEVFRKKKILMMLKLV